MSENFCFEVSVIRCLHNDDEFIKFKKDYFEVACNKKNNVGSKKFQSNVDTEYSVMCAKARDYLCQVYPDKRNIIGEYSDDFTQGMFQAVFGSIGGVF